MDNRISRETINRIAIILVVIILLVSMVYVYLNRDTVVTHTRAISHIAWHPTENSFVTVSDQDGTVVFWQWNGNDYTLRHSFHDARLEGGGIQTVAWDPRGEYLAIAGLFEGIFIYSPSGKLLQFMENTDENSVFTLAWSPSGGELAVLYNLKDAASTEVRIYEVNRSVPGEAAPNPVITASHMSISDIPVKSSFSNHITWISDDAFLVATSGSSNSADGNITTVHLRGSGPEFNFSQPMGSIYSLQYHLDTGFGLIFYTVHNVTDPGTFSLDSYNQYAIFDDQLQVSHSFNQSDIGNLLLDPRNGDLIDQECTVNDNNIVEECNISRLDPESLDQVSTATTSFAFSWYNQYWSPVKPLFIEYSLHSLDIYSSETFELVTSIEL
jgi:hypothetical protein